MVLSVEDVVWDMLFLQLPGQPLGGLYRSGSHQHRSPEFVHLHDLFYYGLEFFFLSFIDHIRMIFPNHRSISGDNNDIQLIYLGEFCGFGFGCTSHAGEFVI